ncbi:MAG: hypothetical protein HC831_21480 [Chloroflexia bacterium]|nr:hypothetical protein [Chloroflexia bacterium]
MSKSFSNTEGLPSTDYEKFIVVKDVGNYQLTANDLSNFSTPLNGLEITLIRGNYQLTGAGSQNVAFCAFDSFKTHVKLN